MMIKIKNPCVYFMASRKGGAIYIGVTSNLKDRIFKHKLKLLKGFSSSYNCTKLVYYEEHRDMLSAIKREKQLKFWKRIWKIKLIEQKNADWRDLYKDL